MVILGTVTVRDLHVLKGFCGVREHNMHAVGLWEEQCCQIGQVSTQLDGFEFYFVGKNGLG